MGAHHTRLYSELPGCELVGIYDPDIGRATDVTERFGGTVFRQMTELLEAVDAVSIVSPTTTHAAVAHRALDFGLHLLVEKPMTATVAEASCLVERANNGDRVLLVGHVERFNPTVLELQRIIAGKRVRRVALRRIAPFNNRCLDTDVVSDLMIHDIDLVRSLFGSHIRSIAAQGEAVCTEHTDQALVELSLTDGPQVSLIASRVGELHTREIDVTMEGSCVLADLLHRTITTTSATPEEGRSLTGQYSVPPAEPLRLELQHFLDCIANRETPRIDADAGLRAIEWVERIEGLIRHRNATQLAEVQVGGLH
jgi:predicted dehydrogenase